MPGFYRPVGVKSRLKTISLAVNPQEAQEARNMVIGDDARKARASDTPINSKPSTYEECKLTREEIESMLDDSIDRAAMAMITEMIDPRNGPTGCLVFKLENDIGISGVSDDFTNEHIND